MIIQDLYSTTKDTEIPYFYKEKFDKEINGINLAKALEECFPKNSQNCIVISFKKDIHLPNTPEGKLVHKFITYLQSSYFFTLYIIDYN